MRGAARAVLAATSVALVAACGVDGPPIPPAQAERERAEAEAAPPTGPAGGGIAVTGSVGAGLAGATR